jgi:hypothetical protein
MMCLLWASVSFSLFYRCHYTLFLFFWFINLYSGAHTQSAQLLYKQGSYLYLRVVHQAITLIPIIWQIHQGPVQCPNYLPMLSVLQQGE